MGLQDLGFGLSNDGNENPSLSNMGEGFINWGYIVVGGIRRWIIGRYFHPLAGNHHFSTPSFIWCFEGLSLRLHRLPHHLLHLVGEIALVDDPVQVFPIQSGYILQQPSPVLAEPQSRSTIRG